MTIQDKRIVTRKLKVLRHAEQSNNISYTCRHFGISRQTFYEWRHHYREHGESGLVNRKPGFKPGTHPKKISKAREELILYLRTRYHFGPHRIAWYLERYHDITISMRGVYYVLKRHGLNVLPNHHRKRSIPTYTRYEKQVPGHHVQIDVQFLFFKDIAGKKIKRWLVAILSDCCSPMRPDQFTAIDDATRIRALKIYDRHTQANAIRFVDHVVSQFPFRIHTIRTDNGHEFQAQFHWHVRDLGMHHVYIKPATPRLNGKVERSHRTDQEEFYQLLSYTGDQDLAAKLTEWERFYNFHRPHMAHQGKTPFEILQSKLKS